LPIFEYECAKCKKTFELLVLGGLPKTVKCEFCGSRKTRKLLSSFSVGAGKTDGSNRNKSSSACSTCSSKSCSSCG
jgi:putative FmdB family regulatory protein